ncbi:AcrR family transcriptional regulator [Mycobacterium frederiksbergense]|uniref:AcrR family transcriptional regulator n=2 Tax=Mycolicibacterium frederiksbergense TaxID=117567 RepID=A0ABT6KZ22_9MYCO|nr:AcrR family transcriptional regulator [Mycolicibacterium frederiksbergense]
MNAGGRAEWRLHFMACLRLDSLHSSRLFWNCRPWFPPYRVSEPGTGGAHTGPTAGNAALVCRHDRYAVRMAGGTKRLPRAVREQQMLDAAVQIFSVNGYHETSMDSIAAEAEISKPMLYLYYGSKEELFAACLNRELTRFVDVVRAEIDFSMSPKDLLRNAVVAFLSYIDTNRASWMVLYTQATSSQAFAHTVREGRERIIDLVARLLSTGTRNPQPDSDFEMMAVALVGAGEAIASRVSTGDADVHEAAELMINLFWRGLKGTPSDTGSHPVAG